MFNTHVKISQIRIKIIKDQELVLENSGFLMSLKRVDRQREKREEIGVTTCRWKINRRTRGGDGKNLGGGPPVENLEL